MVDLGVVRYRVNMAHDGLDATWYYSDMNTETPGTGIAKGDVSDGFSGNFVVTYYMPDGSDAGTFELLISQNGCIYYLTWKQEGKVKYSGIGLEDAGGLSACYQTES